jgi:hypothetical protein
LRVSVVIVFAAGLIWGVRSALDYTRTFIQRHQENLETVRWADGQLPDDAQMIAFGLTATIEHYTSLETYEIYNLTTDDLVTITRHDQPTFVLLDAYNVRTQWKGRAPEVNYRWLRDRRGLVEVGKHGHWTLFKVGRR